MRSGPIDTDQPSSNSAASTAEPDDAISMHIGGIPVADDYTIELRGSLPGERDCYGTTDFDIPAPGAVVRARVVMNCRVRDDDDNGGIVVDGDVNSCPVVSVVVSPLRANVGNTIDLAVTAADPDGDPVTVWWSASEGGIRSPSEKTTVYTCAEPGTVSIELITDDGFDCNITRRVEVVCAAVGE